MKSVIIIAIAFVLLISSTFIQFSNLSYGQGTGTAGGVNVDGTWYLGEGLKPGDYFEYSLCEIDLNDCTPIELRMWIKGDIQHESESLWDAKVVIFDGNKIIKGSMGLSKIAPEPITFDDVLSQYAIAFKSSIAWLGAFATAQEDDRIHGPQAFNLPAWGKIGAIGGAQLTPIREETITIPAGTFDTIVVGWYSGDWNEIWIVDDFPFPVKALTYTWITTGIPPIMYQFTLLDYEENVSSDPFSNVTPTEPEPIPNEPGTDQAEPIDFGDLSVTVFVEITPSDVTTRIDSGNLLVRFFDLNNDVKLTNVTYRIEIWRDGELLARNLYSDDSELNIEIKPVFNCTESKLIKCTRYFPSGNTYQGGIIEGPILDKGGIYEINVDIEAATTPRTLLTEILSYQTQILITDGNTFPEPTPSPDPSNDAEVSFLTTDKNTYQSSELITFSGFVDDLSDGQSVKVNLIIREPSGNILEPKGTFSDIITGDEFDFLLHTSMFNVDGIYSASAYIQSESSGKSTNFGFFADGTVPPPEPDPMPEPSDDVIPPEILIPADILLSINNPDGLNVEFIVKAIDNVDQIITPTCFPSTGYLFPIGETTVECTAIDSAGNTSDKSFTVTVELKDFDVPIWVKDVAGFWCSDEIDDGGFIQAIQYLITTEVIVIPTTESGSEETQDIPDWIKNNACWWSQGIITDGDFINAIQYLISNGIVSI